MIKIESKIRWGFKLNSLYSDLIVTLQSICCVSRYATYTPNLDLKPGKKPAPFPNSYLVMMYPITHAR